MKLCIFACWLWMAFSFVVASAQVHHIDLKQWGYSPPLKLPNIGGPGEYGRNPHFLSFFSNGDMVVGFVTRAGDSLTTREHSLLAVHALTFNESGEFLSEKKFPTTDWYENDLFAGEGNNLLVRIGKDLNLYSLDGKLLANREIQDRDPRVLTLPNRQAFVVKSIRVHPHQYIFTVIDSHGLDVIKTCYCTKCLFESVSDHNVLIHPLVYPDYPPVNRVVVAQFCGPVEFKYEKGLPSDVTLIDDNHLVLANSERFSIGFFDHDTSQWNDSFGKHDGVDPQVAVDEKGDRFAVLVRTYVGGSNLFDINGSFKSERIVVYSSASGKRLAEVPIEKLKSNVFNFQLSPDGKLLAILSDGDLELYPIDAR